MLFNRTYHRVLTGLLILSCFLIAQTSNVAAQKGKKKDYVMTEAELQSELMSFADRFVSIMTQAFEDFEAIGPKPEARRFILSDLVYSQSAIYTLAAEPDPEVALLNMIVVTTLGRMIYENNLRRRFGNATRFIIKGFQQLEPDIWEIASKVLTKAQQQELRRLISEWHKDHPDIVVYNYLRFSDIRHQGKSTLVKEEKTGGLFKSIQQVTQQVEEARMLAERGIFLATRLPLLTGNFADVWMSQALINPELKKITSDIHSFSEVSQRMVNVAEQLPNQVMQDISTLRWKTVNQIMNEISKWSDVTLDKVMEKVAVEREAFINQFMNRLIGEQKIALEALLTEEQRLTGLVTELRKAIEGGNNLLLTANELTEKFNVGEPSTGSKDAKPFDIKDYQDTIAEVTTLVEATNRLVGTVGLEELLPQLVKAIDEVGGEGQELVDHGFRQGVLFMLIVIGAYVFGRLIYNYLNKRLIQSRP